MDPNPDLVLEIETDPAAWVLQDADSASGYLTRFAIAGQRPAGGGSDGAARRSIVLVLVRIGERAILEAFAEIRDSPGVPGPGIPDIGIVCGARGDRCCAARAEALGVLRSDAAAAGRIAAGQEER
jgi:hypothetical protein